MSDRPTCPASLMIRGEHFPCQTLSQMATLDGSPATSHDGWAHSNSDAEAIWSSDVAVCA
jgi:hypothetical protein